jgi:death on curing protein
MRYLTTGEVIRISEAEVGDDVLADFGLLDAAVQRPQQSAFGTDAYSDIHHKAAALLHSIARNHPFVDGNKRVGAASMIVFYNLNGWTLPVSDQGDLVALVVDVAEGLLTVDAIANTLKGWAQPVEVVDDDD